MKTDEEVRASLAASRKEDYARLGKWAGEAAALRDQRIKRSESGVSVELSALDAAYIGTLELHVLALSSVQMDLTFERDQNARKYEAAVKQHEALSTRHASLEASLAHLVQLTDSL